MCLMPALFLCAALISTAAADSLYQVGNSLTNDSYPRQTAQIAAQSGVTLEVGKHIRSSSSLTTIWDNPDSFSRPLEPYGSFTEGLPGYDWDFITLQPHNGQASTQNDDFARIDQFVAHAQSQGRNADTQFYIYAAWPERANLDHWNNGVGASPDDVMLYSDYYFDTLMQGLNQQYGDQFRLIPMGHVLEEIRVQADAGLVPGLTSATHLFRDFRHMNNFGSYVASATVHATLYGESPVGKEIPSLANISDPDLELFGALQQIIWNVVTRNAYSGVTGKPAGDFDGDGDTDAADYTLWRDEAAIPVPSADGTNDGRVDMADRDFLMERLTPDPVELVADYNGDGLLDLLDYDVWQSAFGQTGQQVADGNADGIVDAADFTLWQDAKSSFLYRLEADYNGDGIVSQLDLDVWEAENGIISSDLADANSDGLTNVLDYQLWKQFYTGSLEISGQPAVTAVPEPAAVAVLLFTLAFAGCLRKRSMQG